jgi:hypothetical protein
LISLQGTGAAGLPLTHIRYDYRRLGRATAATILHGRKPWIAPATFLPGKTTRRTNSAGSVSTTLHQCTAQIPQSSVRCASAPKTLRIQSQTRFHPRAAARFWNASDRVRRSTQSYESARSSTFHTSVPFGAIGHSCRRSRRMEPPLGTGRRRRREKRRPGCLARLPSGFARPRPDQSRGASVRASPPPSGGQPSLREHAQELPNPK